MIRTFSRKPIARTRLFSIYHEELDEVIVNEASKNDLYLVGGTAVEMWLNHLGFEGHRKRSINDFDFVTYESNPKIDRFSRFLLDKGLESEGEVTDDLNVFMLVEDGEVVLEVDLLFDLEKDFLEFGTTLDGDKVMSPEYLFWSKFSRMIYLDKVKEKEKRMRDLNDLKNLLKVIKKLELYDEFDEAFKFFYGNYPEPNKIEVVEKFINKELKNI